MQTLDFLNTLAAHSDAATTALKSLIALALEISGACAALAAILPKPANRVGRIVRRVLDLAAWNVLNATNRDTPP